MMPQSSRHGSALLGPGNDGVIESKLDCNVPFNSLPRPGEFSFGRPADTTPPSGSSNITTIPERRKDKPPAQVPCRYFNAGYCARGAECSYNHDLDKVRLQKVHLKTVLKSCEDERLREEALKTEPLLPKEYMLPGRHQKALTHWRNDYWESKVLQARAYQSQQAKDREERQSEKSKVKKDVKRLQNKVDPIGESARTLTEVDKQRKTVFVKGNPEDPGVPIPLEAEGCPICQDEPRAVKQYGLMSNCNHVFCYECIIGWRKADATNKNCPICRARSSFIVKSSVYPYTPGVKLEDNCKPVESPKIPPESNKLAGSKLRVQADAVENATTGLTDAGDIVTDIVDQHKTWTEMRKCTHVDTEAGDRRSPLGIFEAGNLNPPLKADGTKQATIISLGSEEKYSNSEDVDHEPVSALHLASSDRDAFKKRRSRRKPARDPDDPNPAKTLLLKNYLQKCKTTPCKYFCNPRNTRSVILDFFCADTQSSLWGEKNTRHKEDEEDISGRDILSRERKIPYCKFGNNCNYAHPNPEKPDQEYRYDDWERRVLGFSRRRKRGGNHNQDAEDGDVMFAMAMASFQI